ncbi:uncharacterized protein LOC109710687 [Ananas comosus]|uniref:Uncharacterized protein LOC109710687 n=1 Tax=Ananas comosus TaxID=4615 RepID=A0A6P5EYV0_ANACO|nr:uncharacterized protein LOC109710687 [Ananas comosus]
MFDTLLKERELGEINKQLRNKLEAEEANQFSKIVFTYRYHQFVPPEATIPRTAGGENNFMLGWVL